MSGFHVARASGADIAAIEAGFRAAFPGSDGVTFARHMAALRRAGDAGWSGVVARDAHGSVVATLAAVHVPFVAQGRPATFARLTACWVHPAYVTGGLHSVFVEMDETFAEAFESSQGIAVLFGIVEESDWWFLRRFRDFVPVRTTVRLQAPASGTPVAEASDGDVNVIEPDAGSLAGSPDTLDLGECTAVRSGVTLAVRLHAAGPGARVFVARRAGVTVGAAITAPAAADGTLELVDWAVPEGDVPVARRLWDAAITACGAPVLIENAGAGPWVLFFQRNGCRVAAGPERYLIARKSVNRLHAEWLAEHWALTTADVGGKATAEGTLSAGEAAVAPPPPGTLTGSDRHT